MAVASPRLFDVELERRTLLRRARGGRAGPGASAPPAVRAAELALVEIVAHLPLEAGFLQKLEGRIDLGFSFAKANLETRWTLNCESTTGAAATRES